jgi:hypothetical protein
MPLRLVADVPLRMFVIGCFGRDMSAAYHNLFAYDVGHVSDK